MNNPQAAKSNWVEEELSNRLIPLEQWQLQLIAQGKAWHSTIENLRAEMSSARAIYHRALACEYSAIESDEALAATDKDVALMELLGQTDWPQYQEILAAHHSSLERAADAAYICNQIINSLDADDEHRLDLLI